MPRLLLIAILAASVSAASAEDPKPAAKSPYERLLTGANLKNAEELEKKIDAAEAAKQDDEAIKISEQLLALRTMAQGADHWETVNLKWSLDARRKVSGLPEEKRAAWRKARQAAADALKLEDNGEEAKAQTLWETYRRACVEILGEKHPETAISYYRQASNLNDQSKFLAAHPLFVKALDVRREVLGEMHPDTAESYSGLAFNLHQRGQYSDAQTFAQKDLEIMRAVHGEKSESTATSYNNLAVNLKVQGKLAEAEVLYLKALMLSRELRGDTHPFTATSYNNLALNLNAQGKYSEARKCFEKALEIRRERFGEKHADTAASYSGLAGNYDDQGWHAEAQPLFQKALDIRRERFGDKHLLITYSYNNLALNLNSQQKYAEATGLFEKALAITRDLLGEKHADTAVSYSNVGYNLRCQGKYSEAHAYYQKALDIDLELLGENHLDTALTCYNVADNLHCQQKYAEAKPFLVRSATIWEAGRVRAAGRGRDRAVVALKRSPYRLLAATLAQLGDPVAAWDAAEADLARALGDEAAFRQGITLTAEEQKLQASLTTGLNQLRPRISRLVVKQQTTEAEAEELSRLQAERRTLDTQLGQLAVGLSKRELEPLDKVQAALPADAALVLWIDVSIPGGLEEHWGCVVRRTGEPRWQRLPGTGPGNRWSKEDTDLAHQLQEALSSPTASAAELENLAQKLRVQRLTPLVRHLDGIKSLCVVPVRNMASIPVEVLTRDYTISYIPSGTFLARVRAKPAPTGKSLLAVGDPVFTRPEAKPTTAKPLPPGGLLITDVAPESAAANARLQRGDVLVRYGDTELTSADKLGEAIKSQADAKEITLTVWREGIDKPFARTVPPGKLGVVLDKEPAREALANRRKNDESLLALRGGEWNELPGTRSEVAQLAKMFGSATTTLLDGAASEQTLDAMRERGELTSFRYLHFATHGKKNKVREFGSSLILAQDNLPANPLPAAGKPFINGQLAADEVLEFWKLDAELVTLSACETGLGRRGGGDGLLGFAQAFLIAGSRSVCLSLWKVDDAATALLMARFYQNLLGKRDGLGKPMPKALALAEAKRWLRELSAEDALRLTAAATNGVVRGSRGKDEDLKLVVPDVDPKKPVAKDLKPFAHPRYWSAFVLIGDPN